jgi:hypothetical protein
LHISNRWRVNSLTWALYCPALFMCFVPQAFARDPYTFTSGQYFQDKVKGRSPETFCYSYLFAIGLDLTKLAGTPAVAELGAMKVIRKRVFLVTSMTVAFFRSGPEVVSDGDLTGPSRVPHAWIKYVRDDELGEPGRITECGTSFVWPFPQNVAERSIEHEVFDFSNSVARVSGLEAAR